MTANSTELSGLPLALFILQEVSKQAIGCKVYPQNRTASISEYPFVSYNIVVPEIETTGDWLGEDRQYTAVVQLDVHASNQVQAMRLSETLYEALHDVGYRRFFKQANILPQNITNTSNRTVLTDQNYDQDFGFDCSFLINGTKKYDTTQLNLTYENYDIDSVHVTNNNVAGTDLDVSRK